MTRNYVFDTVGSDLTDFTTARRVSIRPLHLRTPDFDALYDSETILYSAVRTGEREIKVIAPPLLNLSRDFEEGTVKAFPSGEIVQVRIEVLDRLARFHVTAPPGTSYLSYTGPLGTFTITIQENYCHLFAGRNVIFTLSKNNQTQWIRDWICFHRDVHGADAVLIYDNNSSIYSAEELLESITDIPGIEVVAVVRWPYKYGPGPFDRYVGWDSDYCQHGSLEDSRWRFLTTAAAALNGDVDELVMPPRTGSVFDLAARSLGGVARYYGRWVFGQKDASGGIPRHLQLRYAERPRFEKRRLGLVREDVTLCPTKWTIVPGRCPSFAQWKTHKVSKWVGGLLPTREVEYRHFRQISDSWKYNRNIEIDPANPQFQLDQDLGRLMDEVDWA